MFSFDVIDLLRNCRTAQLIASYDVNGLEVYGSQSREMKEVCLVEEEKV